MLRPRPLPPPLSDGRLQPAAATPRDVMNAWVSAARPRQSALHATLCALVLATLWLATRPYYGLIHDSQLYMAQALYRLDPAGFAADLYFRFGSQDRFSVVSALYAPAVAALGVGGAHLAAWAAGQALWLLALVFLLRPVAGAGLVLASAFCAAALVPAYAYGVLQYGEAFATPRLFVEALTMAAIACLCRGRRLHAYLLLAAAMALHPLMALPGLAFVTLVAVPRWRILLTLAAGGALVTLGLGLARIDPFLRLFQQIDADWLALIRARAHQAFVANWVWQTGLAFVCPALCLCIVMRHGTPLQRTLARAAIIVASGVIVVSLIGGDLLANMLVVNLQLWRGTWIALLLGNAFAPLAVTLLPRKGGARPLLLATLATALVEARLGLGTIPFASASLALASLLCQIPPSRRRGLSRVPDIAATGLAATATLLLPAELVAVLSQNATEGMIDIAQRTAVVVAAGGLLACLARRSDASALRWVGTAALALLVWTLWLADQRSDKMRLATTDAPIDPAFAAAVTGRTVYWEDGLHLLWFRFRQPSFYSCYQAAGAMFFRETAFEHARRSDVLRHLDTADFSQYPNENCPQRSDPGRDGPRSAAQITQACRALPDLDAMVLYSDLRDLPHLRWQPGYDLPVPGTTKATAARRKQDGLPRGTFNLYDCHALR